MPTDAPLLWYPSLVFDVAARAQVRPFTPEHDKFVERIATLQGQVSHPALLRTALINSLERKHIEHSSPESMLGYIEAVVGAVGRYFASASLAVGA